MCMNIVIALLDMHTAIGLNITACKQMQLLHGLLLHMSCGHIHFVMVQLQGIWYPPDDAPAMRI